MKNTALILIVFFTSVSGFSQSKVGTVDIDFIISRMPELPQVNDNLRDYGTSLDKQLQEKMTNYQGLLEIYNTSVDSFTEEQLQKKQSEVMALEQEITRFQQNGVQLMRIREDELKRPLYQKIGLSLEKIAKAENYTQVLSVGDNNAVIYLDPALDLTLAIIADLGILLED